MEDLGEKHRDLEKFVLPCKTCSQTDWTVPSDNDIELLEEFPNVGHAQILINNEKDFLFSYSRNLEVLRVQCHYGFWNSAGFPQQFVGNQ